MPDYGNYGENYWNNKWPRAPIIYGGRALRWQKKQIGVDVKDFISANDAILHEVIKKYNLKKRTHNETAWAVQKFVCQFLTYKYDDDTAKIPEFWQFPFETISASTGDCIANYEEIYTEDGIKKVGDLKVGDNVLSYDFEKKKYCYKYISKIWEKGLLPLKRVHLRNGQWIDVSDEHKLLIRQSQKKSIYKETRVKDLDLSKWWTKKMPMTKKIPYKIRDIEWLNEDLCFVIGHYIAEGWHSHGHIATSGYAITEEIIPLLEKNNILFSEHEHNGLPILTFLKSQFKDYLKQFKTNSFDIHIPEEFFHLPENKLQSFLNGYHLGDGHITDYPDKRGYNNNSRLFYSTVSEQLVSDLQRIHLQLGKPLYVYCQSEHTGFGTAPIYRVIYNSNSHFQKDYGYEGISEVSISYIEDLEEVEMRDFEVQETHNFITKNGSIVKNCEDGGILITSLLINAGIPPWRAKVVAGYVKPGPKAEMGGHGYSIYLADRADSQRSLEWVILDWCFFPDPKIPIEKKPLAKNGGYAGCYLDTWFTFNNQYSWNQEALTIKEGRISNNYTAIKEDVIMEELSIDNIIDKIDRKMKKY